MPTIDSAGRQRVIILGDEVNSTSDSSLTNGGFEEGLSSWTTTVFDGGAATIDTTNNLQGLQSIAFRSATIASGGGTATSSTVAVSGGVACRASVVVKAASANISSLVEVVWYTNASVEISTSAVYSTTNTPTSSTIYASTFVSPPTARFARVRLTGGVPASGSSTGTVYMDAVQFSTAPDKQIRASDVVVAGIPFAMEQATAMTAYIWSQHAGQVRVKWVFGGGGLPSADLKKNGVSVGAASGSDYDCLIGDEFRLDVTNSDPNNDCVLNSFTLCGNVG
jgi:hypothetical protein